MAYVVRKPFTHKGVHYRPNDVLDNYPEDFDPRPEAFLRTGIIIEKDVVVAAPKKRAAKKAAVVEPVEIVEEAAVEETPIEEQTVEEQIAAIYAEDAE